MLVGADVQRYVVDDAATLTLEHDVVEFERVGVGIRAVCTADGFVHARLCIGFTNWARCP